MMSEIKFGKKNQEIQIQLPDGRIIDGPRGATLEQFLTPLQNDSPQVVGAILNGVLRELTYSVEQESQVVPVTMGMGDGMRIYRRSLTFLLETAFAELFAGTQITIDHSVSFGGYYCEVMDRAPLTEADFQSIKQKMTALVEADLPIERLHIPLDEAIAYFKNQGADDKVQLLKHRKKDFLMMYEFNGHRDYHHGYMVPSSKYLKWFDLEKMGEGFVLRFPRTSKPAEIQPLGDYPKLLATFRQYGDWLERLEIDNVGALNDAILEGRIDELILVAEALHEQRIVEMANQIAARKDEIRVILIAGPSSSGKTTSAKRLSVQLLAHGLKPFPLEVDRFFVDRDKTPKDENGEFDFEHLEAIDLKRLNHDLKKLIAGEKVQLPHYNFLTGVAEDGDEIQLEPGQLIIVEGIHGLNPGLVPEIPEALLFRIYLSALTQLNLDRHNRVSTTDTRLIRRIVRDARTRGYSPADTISRWNSVRRGEKKNIFPYQENADMIFNSALVYELAALKAMAEPLLLQVSFGTTEHLEAKRLLSLLEWFVPLDTTLIPDNSLIREFVGGSILKDFKLWGSD